MTTIRLIMLIISLAAIYHAFTYGLWLYKNNHRAGAAAVYALVVAGIVLLVV